ncbi:MAG: hypothetical protein ACOY3D_04295 [Candidatus Omnitrophota bacterium]
MTTLALLGAPYNYVQTEEVISDVVGLLRLDRSLSGTEPSSVYIARQKLEGGNILGLKGLGSRLWEGVDAQNYVDNLRGEWKRK